MQIIVVLFGTIGVTLAVLLVLMVILHQLMLTLTQIQHSMLTIRMEQVIFNAQILFLLFIMVFQVTSTSNNNSCNSLNGSCDGGASVTISANQNPVNFQWSSNSIPINGATSSSISSMCPGNYACDISNANCSIVENFTITEPAAMISTISKTDENCFTI